MRGRKLLCLMMEQYRAEKGNIRKFGLTNSHGTAFAPKEWLYQKDTTGLESSKMYSSSRYKTVLTSAVPKTTPFYSGQYRVYNGNMRNFGRTYRHGTAFPQEECLYQKEATGLENKKMDCRSLWKNSTNLCGSANIPVLWVVV